MYPDYCLKILAKARQDDLLQEAENYRQANEIKMEIKTPGAGGQRLLLPRLGRFLIYVGQKLEARSEKKIAGTVS